jgi:hypothetical protein
MKTFHLRRDQLDIDHLQSTLESPGFQLLREKQQQMLQQLLKQLETEREDVRYVQGQIHALRRVFELPEILTKEIAQKQKASTRAD